MSAESEEIAPSGKIEVIHLILCLRRVCLPFACIILHLLLSACLYGATRCCSVETVRDVTLSRGVAHSLSLTRLVLALFRLRATWRHPEREQRKAREATTARRRIRASEDQKSPKMRRLRAPLRLMVGSRSLFMHGHKSCSCQLHESCSKSKLSLSLCLRLHHVVSMFAFTVWLGYRTPAHAHAVSALRIHARLIARDQLVFHSFVHVSASLFKRNTSKTERKG
jgi:hypothetical protein